MMKSVSMRDVGKALGVSAVTVSKALGGKDGVSESVRAQIVQKAKEMGYRYPDSSRSENESHDVGVLIGDNFFGENEFYASLYKKLVQKLTHAGYFAILEILSERRERELVLPSMVETGKADAIIVLGQLRGEYLQLLSRCGKPLVFLDFYDDRVIADAVVSDGVYGAYCLTDHLISLGHKDIGFIGEMRATSSIMDRYLGYCKAMLLNGLSIRPEWVIPDRDMSREFIDLKLPERLPTAFVCNCDRVAGMLVDKLEGRDIIVPDDVSVVGFDDYIFSSMSSKPLTTFKVDQDGMARAATDMIKDKLRGAVRQTGRLIIGGRMIERESVRDIR